MGESKAKNYGRKIRRKIMEGEKIMEGKYENDEKSDKK